MGRIVAGQGRCGKMLFLRANMRYDDRVIVRNRRQGRLGGLWLLCGVLMLASCKQELPDTVTPDATPTLGGTSEPEIARTLQADAELTAEWIVTQPLSPTATDEPFPTIEPVIVEGVSPVERTGQCPVPEEYVLHVRQGFCLSAPASWTALNVDGGLAASLSTTPGQAISLQPDWAELAEECSLLIYVAIEASPTEHLQKRYLTFAARSDLATLSQIQMHSLGGIALPGFTWSAQDGETGGIYAASLGPNRLVHISCSGTQCSLEDLLPVLKTLRFNFDQ